MNSVIEHLKGGLKPKNATLCVANRNWLWAWLTAPLGVCRMKMARVASKPIIWALEISHLSGRILVPRLFPAFGLNHFTAILSTAIINMFFCATLRLGLRGVSPYNVAMSVALAPAVCGDDV